ncbi:hypothethical protein (plasmid) [Ralstonia solanacearum CMR15]|nr:hypothethical protein [Ralstonia solanacearum CMR15]
MAHRGRARLRGHDVNVLEVPYNPAAAPSLTNQEISDRRVRSGQPVRLQRAGAVPVVDGRHRGGRAPPIRPGGQSHGCQGEPIQIIRSHQGATQ